MRYKNIERYYRTFRTFTIFSHKKMYSKTSGVNQADFWLESKPSPGYRNVGRINGSTGRQPFSIRILEPKRDQFEDYSSSVAFKKEIEARKLAMSKSRLSSVRWNYPAYTDFMPKTAKAYPPDFDMVYGIGNRPDHYYPGLTPKDVLLALGSSKNAKGLPVGSGGRLGYERPLEMRDNDIASSREFMRGLNSFFKEGEIPSNRFLFEIIDRALWTIDRMFQQHSFKESTDISEETYNVLHCLRVFLLSLEQMIREKNSDEKIQSFLHHTILTTFLNREITRRKKETQVKSIPEELAQGAGVETTNLNSVFLSLIKSPQALDILEDIVELVRDLFPEDRSAAQQMTEEVVKPPEGKQFQSFKQYEPLLSDSKHMKTAELVYADGGDVDIVQEMGFEDDPATSNSLRNRQIMTEEYHQSPEAQTTQYQHSAREENPENEKLAYETGKERVYSSQGKEYILLSKDESARFAADEKLVDYLSYLKQPLCAEDSLEVVDRLREIFFKLSNNPGAKEWINGLISAIAEMGSVNLERSTKVGKTIPLLRHEANRNAMMRDLKEILDRFTGNYGLDGLIAAVDDFQALYEDEWEFRDFINETGVFFFRSLNEPGFLGNRDYSRKCFQLMETGRLILAEKYSTMTNRLLNELFNILDNLTKDSITRELYLSGKDLVESLVLDPKTGKYELKMPLLKDIRNVFLPLVAQTLKYIPLPRVELSTPEYDLYLDNIVLKAENILPNLVELTSQNTVQISPRSDFPDVYLMNLIELNILQIETDLRNVEFGYRKKTFPQRQDAGLADIIVGGQGLSIHTKIAVDPYLWYSTVIPMEIKVDIDALKIKMHDTQRDAINKITSGIVASKLRKQICQTLEENIFNFISDLDGLMTNLAGSMGKEDLLNRSKKSIQIW